MNQKNSHRLSRRAQSKPLPHWAKRLELGSDRNDWAQAKAHITRQANDDQPRQLESQYSLLEVEASWKISVSTLYREISRGNLKAVKIGDQWRVSDTNLVDYLKSRETPIRLPGHGQRRA